MATTQKRKQGRRTRDLLEQGRRELPPDDLESLSDQVIDAIRRNAVLEPENQKKLGLVQGSKKSMSLYPLASTYDQALSWVCCRGVSAPSDSCTSFARRGER